MDQRRDRRPAASGPQHRRPADRAPGLGPLQSLEPQPPVQRYERRHFGELLHLDVKKRGRIGRVGHRITGDRRNRVRGIGWEYVHVAVDDASRLAYVEVLRDERAPAWRSSCGGRWRGFAAAAFRSSA